MPEPPTAAALETQAKPTSTAHSALQPSPPAVLLSSHASAVVRTPSPHTWSGSGLEGSGERVIRVRGFEG